MFAIEILAALTRGAAATDCACPATRSRNAQPRRLSEFWLRRSGCVFGWPERLSEQAAQTAEAALLHAGPLPDRQYEGSSLSGKDRTASRRGSLSSLLLIRASPAGHYLLAGKRGDPGR